MAIILGRISPRPSPNRYAPFEPEDSGDGNRIAPLAFSFSGSDTISSIYLVRQLLLSSASVGGSTQPAICTPADICGPRAEIAVVEPPIAVFTCVGGGEVEFKKMTRGDTVELDGHATQAGVDYPLVGKSLWFTGKKAKTDSDAAAIFQRTIGNGIVLTDSAKGKFRVTLVPGNTSGLSALKTLLYWDCQVKDADGKVFTLASDAVMVNADVTLAS